MKKWSYDMIDRLYNLYPMNDALTVCKEMQITPKELIDEAQKLRIYPKGGITCEEEKIVRDYGDSIRTACVFLMDQRTVAEVEALLP